ncbi:DUF3618 domain-containing protein [Actinomyces sp. B33]|uniref:DUF3618 domain-containing protein n=1 Tax=Actinomyces sp. B33 TaxID=2942131 RepID=UPI00234053D2|nr:DUF3618 domain-containing protein [Actinomyces sp. B33]MDC4233479.1 DUF3618 domain-containing protein [Actinomyces sp. B33]
MTEQHPSERTEEQIQAELAVTRAQMSQTIDALVARAQPAYVMEQAKLNVSAKARQTRARIGRTVDEARAGDVEAMKKVGIAALGAAALVCLVIVRVARRSR